MTLEHDIGGDLKGYYRQIENDFGTEAAEQYLKDVEYLESLAQTPGGELNIDLFFHQIFPELFPDPFTGELKPDDWMIDLEGGNDET